MAQDTATLMGQVTDRETGDVVPGAQIMLEGTALSEVADLGGRYILRDIPPGKVEVAISFIGYTTALYKVELRAGETRTLDVGLEQEILIFDDCIVWTEDQQPFREYPDMTFDLPKRTVTSEFDDPCFPQSAWPIHSVADAAALLPGVDRVETTDSLALRGRTAGATAVYVDGIPVMGAVDLPWPAVQSVEVLDGHIPVQYGNASSGVLSITTERGKEPGLHGSLEGLSSEVTDAYGYNEANFSLGGRLGSRAGFFVSGSWIQQADRNPTARALPRLREEVLQDLYENPQALLLVNESDPEDRRIVTIPGEMPPGTTVDELISTVDIPAGYRILSLNPTYRGDYLTEEDFVLDPKKTNNQQTQGRLAAHLDVELLPNMILGVGGYGSTGQRDNWDWGYALFNREPLSQTDSRAGRIYGSLDHAISPSFRYHLLASLDDARSTTYNPRFSSDVRDVLFYGDIDHPANALVPSYLRVNIPD
ncbi:MAG TPA: TonB-dependent receptor, partial [Rhodothermales bacterium]|nr:TonB-dependent receptor [Rhodothermales bacterium]